jgi:hypothetical protein
MSFAAIPWQVIILVATLLTSLGQIFNKHQVNQAASLQVNFYKYSFSLGLVFFYWKLSQLGWPSQWLILLFYGFLTGLSVTLYTKASRHSLSKTVLATPASQVLEIVLAGIIFSEWQLFAKAPQLMLGLVLVPILVWLFYEKNLKSKKWSVLILGLIFYMASLNLFAKYSLKQVEPLQLLLVQYIGCVLAVGLGVKVKEHKFYLGRQFAVIAFGQSMFSSVGTWLYYVGLKKATIAQTTLLRMPVFLLLTTLFGLYIFKEVKSMTTKKWLGVVVAFGIALIVVTAKH